jgi:iron complex transport system substrate-binding protein
MKICSFLPSSTEILFALGLGESVCGVTFECDYPAEARSKPVVVYSKLPPGLAEKEIDRQVCAATPNDLGAVLSSFVHPPQILALTPHNLEDIWTDIQTVGDACERSQQAKQLIGGIKQQIATLSPMPSNPPRVLCLEWLDPPFIGGHWVPEMVALAGGTDVLGKPDHPGVPVSWDAIVASDPDIILAMPCGYHRHEVEKELENVPFPDRWHSLPAVRNGHVFAMDASSHFSRPGPRVIEGILELAELFRSYKQRSRKKVAQAMPVAFQSQVRQRR